MNRYSRCFMMASLACMLVHAGCGDDEYKNPGNPNGQGGEGGSGGEGGGGPAAGSYIRIHYRLQDQGDVKTWGVHFWDAGSTSPMWGSPQLFDKTDDFGAYTDVLVTKTGDTADAWLGFLPVQCSQGNCKKDVETAVRFVDLEQNAENPNIAECWITQGQAVQRTRPTSTGPAYKIFRPRDFVDLGNGSVRMMFRVATGSTGSVRYGASPDALSNEVTWSASDDINKTGLIVTGLTPGSKTYYQISTTLKASDTTDLKDQSEVLDLTPIEFSTISQASDWASWGSSGVMYQLIVRTFADGGAPKTVDDPGAESGIDPETKDGIGDLVGLRRALPYLHDLGADAIWMTPVFKANSYHGYDTTDFYDIDPAVGTRKDFVDLTAAAHELGIKIVLDLVQNHIADVNPWFGAGSDPKSPDFAKYHDWFVWSDDYSNMMTDPHPWDGSETIWRCKNYMCFHKIFLSSMPELNYRNPEVRAEMKKISKFWIDLGADGFRLDASKHIDQFDEINAVPIATHGTHVWWKEFNYYVKKDVVRPVGSFPVLLTGENRWDDPAVKSYMVPYASDMDSQFDFPFRSKIASFVGGGAGDDVDFVGYVKALQQEASVVADGGNPNHFFQRFLSNHDVERPATQFEGTGDSLTAVLKQAASIVFTMPGMPVIYYGEEFGKQGKRAKYFNDEPWDHDEFIREPMSWFSQLSFTGDKMTSWDIDFEKTNADNASLMLDVGICKAPNPSYPFIMFMTEDDPRSWAAQQGDPESLFAHYRRLVAVRKANPMITDLASQLSTVRNTADFYEFTITNSGQTLSVVMNRTGAAQTVTRAAEATDLLTETSGVEFDVPPYGTLILQQAQP